MSSAANLSLNHFDPIRPMPSTRHRIFSIICLVMVWAKDADGNELHRDINDAVGIRGNYVITVGDSITNGIGDENPYNNDSWDGRMVSRQGFQAKLANRLTAV